MPISVKLRKADISIDNSGNEKTLRKHVVNQIIPMIYEKLGYIDTLSHIERKED
jgi:hypothetical protein